jgi:hypothetical protein
VQADQSRVAGRHEGSVSDRADQQAPQASELVVSGDLSEDSISRPMLSVVGGAANDHRLVGVDR